MTPWLAPLALLTGITGLASIRRVLAHARRRASRSQSASASESLRSTTASGFERLAAEIRPPFALGRRCQCSGQIRGHPAMLANSLDCGGGGFDANAFA